MSSIFGKFEPNGIKKLPAPERSGVLSNGFPEFSVFGTEKNLQIDIWSIRYLPNFPELSLKPEEFDLYSEFSSILSVEIVDAQRRIKSQFNTSLCPFSRFTIVSFEASSVILLISKDSTWSVSYTHLTLPTIPGV